LGLEGFCAGRPVRLDGQNKPNYRSLLLVTGSGEETFCCQNDLIGDCLFPNGNSAASLGLIPEGDGELAGCQTELLPDGFELAGTVWIIRFASHLGVPFF